MVAAPKPIPDFETFEGNGTEQGPGPKIQGENADDIVHPIPGADEHVIAVFICENPSRGIYIPKLPGTEEIELGPAQIVGEVGLIGEYVGAGDFFPVGENLRWGIQ